MIESLPGCVSIVFVLTTLCVATAALSIPSPVQQLAFEQPNRAVLYFPFALLPEIVVPIVLFSHLASSGQIFVGKIE